MDQLEGTVRNDQATIDNAKLNLVYCHITSPISGRVGLRLVDPGNMVHATDTNALLVITQLQPIAVLFTLPEDNLPAVSQHMGKGTLQVDAYSRDDQTKLGTGKLETIDNQIDQTTGTGRLKAVFDNKDNALWPNQFVNIRLLLEVRKDSTVIPAAAIQRGPQGTYVFVAKADNTADIRPVTVAFTQDNLANIASGLSPSEVVVTDGQDKLQAGSKIEVRQQPQPPATRSQPQQYAFREARFRNSDVMNPSRIFILRPVATALLMVAIMLVGWVAYRQLPVSALPEVDYPTIQVMTFYPGANPDVMASSVTAPLERQFGQVPGLSQMTSTSSFGSSVITLQFGLDQSIDVEEQQVQAAINAATTYLPSDLPNPPIYSKVNPADSPILTLALTSKSLPLSKVEDLADTAMAQKISQVTGVGLVSLSGGQKPAVRIQANPTALASYGLSLEDVRTALAAANVDQAKGTLNGPRQSFTIGANDQLLSGEQYAPIVVAYRNGSPVRLSDVATITDGIENVMQAAWMNLDPAVIMNIQRQPGANIISVVDRIKKLLPQLQAGLPAAVKVTILTDRTETIRASVKDVQFELMLTVCLVVMVIFLFLRNLWATSIPAVTVPLSIVGTFGVMYLLGYSLNNLTLMALTISTGFVVDDAIVMIENIDRYLEEGDSPLDAALKGAGQIGFTIVSLTVSLIAVLIPLLFMGDIVGRLFREFAVTLAVTILVSAAVSLSLTPMMCAKLLKPKDACHGDPVLQIDGEVLQQGHRVLRPDAQVRSEASADNLAGHVRNPGSDPVPVRDRSQGIFSGAGYGRHSGDFGCAAERVVSVVGRSSASAGAGDPAGPGCCKVCLRSLEWMARTSRPTAGASRST